MRNTIDKLNKSMIDTSLSKDQVTKNLKNGYLALGATFFMTVIGYFIGLQFLPEIAQSMSGLFGFFIFLGVGLGMIFAINAFRNSVFGLVLLLAFGVLEGVFLTPLIAFSSANAVIGSLIGTIVLALGTSYVAIKGNIDSSGWGKFLFFTLLALIVAMLVNIFLQSTMFQILISSAVIIIMSGFMIYDTQQAIKYPKQSYITVALGFYLNIINIFINMLTLFGLSDD